MKRPFFNHFGTPPLAEEEEDLLGEEEEDEEGVSVVAEGEEGRLRGLI